MDTYGNVDLGTLDWNKEGLNFYTISISNNIKKPKDDNTIANIYCNLYRAVPLSAPFVEGDMAVGTHGYLYIRNTRYTTTAEFKEAMRGQILRYELETPANGGYLPMYKGRYKVSDVCQLLDKSKYPATQTIDGVTFTNNGDGTITVNGTCTNPYYSAYKIKENLYGIISGHKYAILGTGTNVSVAFNATYQGGYIWKVSNNIFTLPENEYTEFNSQLRVTAGVSVSNITVKPQLFDLTEMYGAGNEPTTVEEFREKFPNELYPYSPYCWVKMKQMRYLTTTKNLFDNIPVKTNYIINSNGEEVATSGYNIYGKMYGNNFTISTNAPVDLNGPDNWLRVCLYNSEGTFITRKDFDFNTRTVTNIADDNIAYIQLCFHRASFPNYKLQVELGSTATPYVPYGYLPLK